MLTECRVTLQQRSRFPSQIQFLGRPRGGVNGDGVVLARFGRTHQGALGGVRPPTDRPSNSSRPESTNDRFWHAQSAIPGMGQETRTGHPARLRTRAARPLALHSCLGKRGLTCGLSHPWLALRTEPARPASLPPLLTRDRPPASFAPKWGTEARRHRRTVPETCGVSGTLSGAPELNRHSARQQAPGGIGAELTGTGRRERDDS